MKTILLVATWKAWTVPILIVIGIAGRFLRGLIEMVDNFARIRSVSSFKASIQGWSILAVFVIAAILVGLCGCVIGRLDSDNLRIIPLSEVHRMDCTPWHPKPHTLNESIDKTNK